MRELPPPGSDAHLLFACQAACLSLDVCTRGGGEDGRHTALLEGSNHHLQQERLRDPQMPARILWFVLLLYY